MSFFSKDAIVEQSSAFIGELQGNGIVNGSFGDQLELEIQALDHETKGPYKVWLKMPAEGKKIRSGSKLAFFIEKLAEQGVEIATNGSGEPKAGDQIVAPFKGLVGRWERGKKSFDGGKTTSEYTVLTEVLTREQADAEIKANGGIRRKGEGAGTAATTTNGTAAQSQEISPEQVELVLSQFGTEGLARPGMVQVATKNTDISGNKPLQKYIMSGAFVKDMVAEGRLFEENGVFFLAN